MTDVNVDPVKDRTKDVTDQTFVLDKSEGEIVLVVTKDPVEALIAIILVIDRIVQDLKRTQNNCVEQVVPIKVGNCSTETTRDHVSNDDHHGDESLVDKRLHCFGQPKLNLVAVLEQQVAYGGEVLNCHIYHCLEVNGRSLCVL